MLSAVNEDFVNISNIVKKTALVRENCQYLERELEKKLNEVSFTLKHINVFEIRKIIDTKK